MAFDVFISHSTKDKTIADAACAALENAGIRCWIAPRDILPGLEWDEAIVRAIDQCSVMLLIFSSSANESRQIRREVKRAFNRGVPVVPLRIEEIVPTETMAYYMDSVHWLDAMTPPVEQHLARLVEAVRAFLQADSLREDQTPRQADGRGSHLISSERASPPAVKPAKEPTANASSTPLKPSGVSRRRAIALGAAGAVTGLGTLGVLTYRTDLPWKIARDVPRVPGAPSEGNTGVVATTPQRRVAMVVGNAAYQNVPPLRTATIDANAIAEMFKSAGFHTVSLLDATVINFKRAIRNFEDIASNADVAVFYFTGYGIEVSATNFLVPIDAKLVDLADAQDEAVALEKILASMQAVRQMRLVILDACRDNPFKSARVGPARSISAGLAGYNPPYRDMLLAFAAKAGTTAADGDGPHSLYTTSLLRNLPVPGLDIRLGFGRVRDEVLSVTKQRQEPFVYGSLSGEMFTLVPISSAAKG